MNKPRKDCNLNGHNIVHGVCTTCGHHNFTEEQVQSFKDACCWKDEPDYSEITKSTIDYVEWKNKKQKEDTFIKADSNKPNLAILFDTGKALEQVANVMTMGAKKYSRCNWKMVDDKERYISACLRHLLAYSNGEHFDSESGLNHLAHAVCSLLFLLEMEE